MNTQDPKFQKFVQEITPIFERMAKAGYIKQFGDSAKSGGIIAADFTAKGEAFARAVRQAHVELHGLSQREIVILWLYLTGK